MIEWQNSQPTPSRFSWLVRERSPVTFCPGLENRALNRFLLGWAGYFHYGNSTVQSSQITRHADTRPALWVAKHHEQDRRYGWQALAVRPDRFGLISLNGIIVAPRPNRSWRRGR